MSRRQRAQKYSPERHSQRNSGFLFPSSFGQAHGEDLFLCVYHNRFSIGNPFYFPMASICGKFLDFVMKYAARK
jgi:hypothetical protein